MTIVKGMSADLTHTVIHSDLAIHWGGQAEVLSSPVLIGALERVCVKATDHLLDAQSTTVGVSFEIQHLAPTPLDWEISAHCELIEINDRMLTFAVEATDQAGKIASGRHTRCIVSKQKFDLKLKKRTDLSSLQGEKN
jgi:predicted thioesterase